MRRGVDGGGRQWALQRVGQTHGGRAVDKGGQQALLGVRPCSVARRAGEMGNSSAGALYVRVARALRCRACWRRRPLRGRTRRRRGRFLTCGCRQCATCRPEDRQAAAPGRERGHRHAGGCFEFEARGDCLPGGACKAPAYDSRPTPHTCSGAPSLIRSAVAPLPLPVLTPLASVQLKMKQAARDDEERLAAQRRRERLDAWQRRRAAQERHLREALEDATIEKQVRQGSF